LETVTAIHGLDAGRFERNLCLCSATGAVNRVKLTFAAIGGGLLASPPATEATSRLVQETFFGKKFLFLNGEKKLIATFFTYQGFVFHLIIPPELDFLDT